MSIQSISHALLVACSKNVSIPYAYVICWLSVVLHSSLRGFNSHLSPVFPSIGAIHLAEQAAALILEACLSSDLAMISAAAAGNSFLEWMRVTRLLTIPSGSLFTPRVLREREKEEAPCGASALCGITCPYVIILLPHRRIDSRICRPCLNTSLMTLCTAQHMWLVEHSNVNSVH